MWFFVLTLLLTSGNVVMYFDKFLTLPECEAARIVVNQHFNPSPFGYTLTVCQVNP